MNYSLKASQIQAKTIKRQIDILLESTDLVNNSNNLDIVLRRYQIVCNTLIRLLAYTPDELKSAGFILKSSLNDTLDFIQNNRAIIINQAIERNILFELSLLKTTKGKIQKLNKLYEKIKNNANLEKENLAFLEKLYSNTIINCLEKN